MSPIATRLYRHLRGQPDGTNLTMEELTVMTRASKTAIRAAFGELANEGKLTFEQTS